MLRCEEVVTGTLSHLLVLNNHLRRWSCGDPAYDRGVPRVSGRPNGEHDGEDDAIHEGDYAQIETDGSVFCWRRWRRLRKEATAFIIGTRHVRTAPFVHSPTCERVFNVLSRGFKWLHIFSGLWFTRVLGHSACYVVRLLVLKERLGYIYTRKCLVSHTSSEEPYD